MMSSKVKYSSLIASWLKDLGYTHCFFLPGGGCMHLVDSFRSSFKCIPVVHEVSAGIAAEHFNEGSIEGKAFALVTTGPGLTNIVTAVASCYTEHRELLIIAGQVKSSDLAPVGVRQLGVQEVNGKELFHPITVSSHCLDWCMPEASFKSCVQRASGPHPGPVLIEICLDIQGMLVDPVVLSQKESKQMETAVDQSFLYDSQVDVEKLIELIKKSERPLFLIGGLINRKTAWQVIDLLNEKGIPVATTTSAIDRVPSDLKVYAGRPSTWGGQRAANLILAQADLLIAFGVQFDLQQTGFNVDAYAPSAQIVQVFPSDAELHKRGPSRRIGINMEPNTALNDVVNKCPAGICPDWLDYISSIRKHFPALETANKAPCNDINPFVFLRNLSEATQSEDIFALSSSGIAFTAALQMYFLKRNQIASVSCAFASMGYGLATAIGLSFARPDRRVILVEGDGSFSQNMQELAVVRKHNLNVKIFLFDNGGYASIRATQKKFFNGDYVGCDESTGLGFPKWELLFNSFCIPCITLNIGDESTSSLKSILSTDSGPCAYVVKIDPDGRSWPLVRTVMNQEGRLSSAPLFDMAPRITPEEREQYGRYIPSNYWE